jgi:hypothetical protein
MMHALDDLAIFEELKAEMLPQLRSLIQKGASSKEILGSARAAAVARLELLDRIEGKPKEQKDITHHLAKLKDEEIDALLITAISENSDEEE